MDKNFLEFWGNFLIQTAKGQRQLEDMVIWIRQGFSGFEDLRTMFLRVYGIDRFAEGSPDYLKMSEKAQEAFKNSFRDYLSMFGVVPKEDHLALVKKYEELKEKVAHQEETIKNLQALLSSKMIDPGEVVDAFQELIRKQSDQFQKIMESVAQFFQTPLPNLKDK